MSSQKVEKTLRPKNLNIEMIAAELGFSHLSKTTQINALLQYQREDGLVLKSEEPLHCIAQLTSSGTCDSGNSDNQLERFSTGETFEVETSGQPITFGPLFIANETQVGFEKFSIDGFEMYPVHENEIEFITLLCDVDDLFIDRDDFERFLDCDVGEIPHYANPTSDHYAPELVLAVELHNDLRVKNKGNPKHSMKDQVYLQLKNKYRDIDLTDARVNRLATIIGDGKKLPKALKPTKSIR